MRYAVASIVLVLVALGPAFAAPTYVSGRVVTEGTGGGPVVSAVVTLRTGDRTDPAAVTQTLTNGSFILRAPAPGDYRNCRELSAAGPGSKSSGGRHCIRSTGGDANARPALSTRGTGWGAGHARVPGSPCLYRARRLSRAHAADNRPGPGEWHVRNSRPVAIPARTGSGFNNHRPGRPGGLRSAQPGFLARFAGHAGARSRGHNACDGAGPTRRSCAWRHRIPLPSGRSRPPTGR